MVWIIRTIKFYLITLVLLTSCASTYKPVGPSYKKRTWRVCKREKDNPTLHLKGLCYIEKQCKKRFLHTVCKNKQLFCPWGDLTCMEKYELLDKRLR
jgi:hypothetical protein